MTEPGHARLLTPIAASQHRASLLATVGALTLASAAETWTTSGVSLSLTDLTGTLSASSDEASWALTVYMSAYTISIALSHRLSLRFGNRRYLGFCSILYALASTGCALSPGLAVFLAFRAIAGFAGGVFLVRAFVFFTQQFEPAARVKPLVGYAIAYFFLGRLLSPLVCGWLADEASWRLLFALPSLLMLSAAFLFFRHTENRWIEDDISKPMDYIGIIFLVIGAICLQTVLSRGEIDGWFESPVLLAITLAGVAGNTLFVVWQFSSRNRYPLLDFSVLQHRSARAGAVLGFLVGILLAGSLYVIPQYLRGIESYSAMQTGALLSIGGAAAVLTLGAFPTIVVVLAKFGGRSVILLALFVEIASQLLFARYLTPDTPDHYLWLPLALNGIFIALSVPTLGIVAFADIKSHEASNARAMYYGCRQLGASIGITCAIVTIDRRMSLHSSRLLDAFSTRDNSILGAAANMTERALAAAVRRQSSVLSYADVFYAMAAVAVVSLFFVPLLATVSTAASPEIQSIEFTPNSSPGQPLRASK